MSESGSRGDKPRISIVIAPIHTGAALPGALAALASRAGAPSVEIIIPVDDTIDVPDVSPADLADVRVVEVEGTSALARSTDPGRQHEAIDRRRAAGLAASRAELVVMTDEYARPDADWCRHIAALHDELPHAVIGGAIENANRRIVNHALFLADVGRYQNPVPEGPASFVSDLNVSYKRGPLFDVREVWQHVYNETGVHDALRSRGHTLWLSRRPVVRIDRGPVTARHALREAFAWARLYAGRRTRDIGMAGRLALAVTAPLLAPLLLTRQARIALTRGGPGAFMRCLPFLLLVDVARAAGEWTGYVTGREASLSAAA